MSFAIIGGAPPQLPLPEQKAVIAGFDNLDHTRTNGITLAGTKYFTISANERSIYGKKAVCYPSP